jgi:hypothetical protein
MKTLTEIKLSNTRLALYDALVKLDKIKTKLLSNEKVSKKELLKIIEEDKNAI